MACLRCGASVPEGSRFCPGCGRVISHSGVATLSDGADDVTRLASSTRAATPSPDSGWLSSSDSIAHGRFAPGTILENRYRIVGLVGRGGMALALAGFRMATTSAAAARIGAPVRVE